jgi:N-methylhydantoinase B
MDKVMLGVLNHYFRAAAEAMGFVLERTAYTTFIKESNDFTTGIVTPRGEHFAYPVAIGAQSYVGIDFRHLLRQFEPWDDGDIGICNCPYLSHGVSTHLPDYHAIKPIFVDGIIVAYAWGFIHSSDMGGIVAGSILPSAYELFQEGLRIPPLKLYRRSVVQEDVKAFLLTNVRIPEKNWGDLNALVAALATAEQRVQAAAAKWGRQTVEEARDALVDYAEERARAIIDRLPDGTYEFADYLEDDVISDMPVRVKVRATKRPGGNLHLDFTGTDPQLSAAFNLASHGRHPFLCGAMFGYLRSVDPTIPVNGGLMRPITITAPEGSLVNPVFPAPCGIRYAVTQLVYGIVQGILAQAAPGTVPAAGAGQATILAISLLDPASGRRRITVVQPMIGGSGGRTVADGVDACDFSLGSLANTPVEAIENEVPIVIRQYGVVCDSGGPGTHRGGLAARLDFQVFHPDTIVTARGMERFRFQPWGLAGGHAGANGGCWLNPGTPGEKRLGKINMIRLRAGDTLSIRTPGGGGYGNPFVRDPAAVAADVRAGIVSAEAAQEQYGVVVNAGGEVNSEATTDLRKRPTPQDRLFDLGKARSAHQAVFTPEVSDALAELLFELPAGLRYYAKGIMFERINALAATGTVATPDEVRNLGRKVLTEMHGGEDTAKAAGRTGNGL